MKLVKRITAAAVAFLLPVMVNCNKDPLLTELKTKKLIVVLKGTYESNSPKPWSMPPLHKPVSECDPSHIVGDVCTDYSDEYMSLMQDDSVYECASTSDTLPTVFMIDMSEIRLWDTSNTSYKFSNYRQTYASALSDNDPMFNGAGHALSNDDVPSKGYSAIALYVRKMLLNGAKSYVARDDGWDPSVVWDVFAEGEYPTYNFNTHQVHSYFDSLRLESTSINRVYPLIIPINDLLTGGTGMLYNGKFIYTVLEIRIVVKNFIKKYEQKATVTNKYKVTHYHGLSDWLNDVEKGDTVIGGNVIAVARSYIPQLVGKISGTATPGRHVIAIPAGSNILAYTLNVDPYTDVTVPDAAPWTESNGTLRSLNPCNLPKKPTIYTGTSIYRALEYFLKMEDYKIKWNNKVPQGTITDFDDPTVTTTTRCDTYATYKAEWDKFATEVGVRHFAVPQLAVYAPTADDAPSGVTPGEFTIENVMPGNYDVYEATRAPEYGKLYYNHYDTATQTYVPEFTLRGRVTVTSGATASVP